MEEKMVMIWGVVQGLARDGRVVCVVVPSVCVVREE